MNTFSPPLLLDLRKEQFQLNRIPVHQDFGVSNCFGLFQKGKRLSQERWDILGR